MRDKMIVQKNNDMSDDFEVVMTAMENDSITIKEFTTCYKWSGNNGTGSVLLYILINEADHVWELLNTHNIVGADTSGQITFNTKFLCLGAKLVWDKGTATTGIMDIYIINDGER
jgi:hypothetical protein